MKLQTSRSGQRRSCLGCMHAPCSLQLPHALDSVAHRCLAWESIPWLQRRQREVSSFQLASKWNMAPASPMMCWGTGTSSAMRCPGDLDPITCRPFPQAPAARQARPHCLADNGPLPAYHASRLQSSGAKPQKGDMSCSSTNNRGTACHKRAGSMQPAQIADCPDR